MKIALVFGTRPETIKLAAVARALEVRPQVQTLLWNTGQHQHLVNPLLKDFGLSANRDLGLMSPSQTPGQFFAKAVHGVAEAISEDQPDLIIVQGDTTTAAATGAAAFYERIPVAHVEAGLRTYDLSSPWPEEYNRRLISEGADWHFAPTETAKYNLLQENIRPERIVVTGNTGIDSLLWMTRELRGPAGEEFAQKWKALDSSRPTVLCTLHRRESFGETLEGLMTAVRDLSDSGEAQVILPLHPNPEVRKAAISVFGDEIPQDLYITAPLDYREFIWLMDKSLFLMSDSGGVQEEAPALGKPVIVTREKTERPEAVLLGANILAGTDPEYILKQARSLLKDRMLYAKMAMPRNIYGDGRAAERICTTLLPEKHFSQEGLVAIH